MNRSRWILGLITHNFGWKALALGCAFVIWVSVASEPELSAFDTVRLEYRNLPANLEISSSPMESVTLELHGPAGELRSERRPSVVLDMTDVMPGERTFAIADTDVSLPRGVRLVRAIPSEVRFDFDRRLVRSVPVEARFAGLGSGYSIVQDSVTPRRLEIVGPASHVARIQAVSTDPVDVAAAAGTSQTQVNAFVPDPYVRFEGSAQVTVTVTTAKR